MKDDNIKVVLTDDHVLLRNGLANVINSFGNYSVQFEANHGQDLVSKLTPQNLPDIVLLDINMPTMDGFETATWLKNNFPSIKVLALSMYDYESAIIRMFKAGARGYILKDCEPGELRAALDAVTKNGYYYSELVSGTLIHNINNPNDRGQSNNGFIPLSDREIEFLKLACSELTYKEIADKMFLSPRTIDGYRDALFEKLSLKTRVGLVMYAIRHGLVNLK